MATRHEQGGASALPTLPPVRKGRKRAAQSMDAAGECSLLLLRRGGKEVPGNVVRLFPLPEPSHITRSPEMAFLLTIYCCMPTEQQDKIKRSFRASAEATREPDFLALANMFEGNGI